MHADELDVDAGLVRRLLAEQLPNLAQLPLSEVRSSGTVNAIFRLGGELCVRLPRVARWAEGLERELKWLPRLALHLSLRVPEPVARGRPTDAYPLSWAVYTWIEGDAYADERVDDEVRAATDLARFVTELRGVATEGAPAGGRRPLRELDQVTRAAIEASRSALGDRVTGAVVEAWEDALTAPAWDGSPVWIHSDLLRPNLLVAGGRLRAVIDFGSAGVGDPAADLIAAWSVFGPVGRAAFRQALTPEAGVWRRARGYALHQALLAIPYYPETNPDFVTLAKRTVAQVLEDVAVGRSAARPVGESRK
jgi:aminoglycoside phosphotransferase (APT) family kinase protein